MGLHCISAAADVGPAAVSVTPALLSTVAVLAAAGKKPKAALTANSRSGKPARPLTSHKFNQIVSTLPDEVCAYTSSCISCWHAACAIQQRASQFDCGVSYWGMCASQLHMVMCGVLVLEHTGKWHNRQCMNQTSTLLTGICHYIAQQPAELVSCLLQVSVSIPSVCIQTAGLISASGQLTCTVENRNFQIQAARQQPRQPSAASTVSDPTQHSPPGISSEAAEQLYWVSVTSGGAHVGLGMTDAVPAVTASINALTTELSLTRPSAQGPLERQDIQPQSAQIHASLTFSDPSTHCCYDSLWPFLAATQQQQHMLSNTSPSAAVPGAALTPAVPSAAQGRAVPSFEDSTGQSPGVAAAEVDSFSNRAAQALVSPLDPQAGTPQQQTGTPQQQAGTPQHQANSPAHQMQASQQSHAPEQQHSTLVLQCILQAHTAGVATFDVASGDGVTQIACSVDAMSASFNVQLSPTRSDAPHLSLQAAVKVCTRHVLQLRSNLLDVARKNWAH